MILSYNWLKELTGATLAPDKLAEALTRVGLNVEDVTPVGGDFALDADVTTNRPDWLCHLGVAYETAATLGLAVKRPELTFTETGPDVASLTSVSVMPGAEEVCPRYTLRVIQGVRVGPSPAWLRDRLTAIGQRSINNVVDITNLVCFEMNQPLHAFDMDKLAEKRIILRLAEKGEQFDAITGEHAVLQPDMLVIADAEKAVALAGVKGGQNTEVSDTTQNVLLESAWFQPRGVRRAARRTRMSSESSYRYERGIDPGMTEIASRRAVSLILELAGGTLATGVIDTNPNLGQPWTVSMRYSRMDKLLGMHVDRDEVSRVFQGLGLVETARDDDAITVEVPSFRQDLRREADLIEEVIRLVGYDKIPEKITMPLALAHEMPETAAFRTIRRTLVGLGYHECITDAFVPEQWGKTFAPDRSVYTIQNPINAERPVLRTAGVPSLLEVRRTNRLAQDVRLFEIGRVYSKCDGKPEESNRLAILDDRGPEYVRGAVEAVARALVLAGDITAEPRPDSPGMAPGSGGRLTLGAREVATYGLLGKQAAESFDLTVQPGVGEVDTDILAHAEKTGRNYQPLPRFPAVRRDISLSLPESVLWSEVEAAVATKHASLLDSLAFESLYRGKGLKSGMKAIAFSMLLRSPERSLTDAEANGIRDDVVQALLGAFPGAELR